MIDTPAATMANPITRLTIAKPITRLMPDPIGSVQMIFYATSRDREVLRKAGYRPHATAIVGTRPTTFYT